ncbi:hypothetical protein V1286_002847 [Bradyrhizobium algeriense]|uniref:DUF1772 domain-containing protein n=1 Tax=Bradyrhizobium algeriense TaxID=634784 RepID=A0ABU8B9U4_9BRAD
MPGVIAALQYATAVTFLVIGLAAYRYGAAGQRAAETAVTRQGFPVEILSRHRVRIEESLAELMLPLGISVVLATLATLNLTAPYIGRIATWIIHPILLIAGGFITAGQVFTVRFVEAEFRKSQDPDARAVDVRDVINAASAVFPVWLRPMIVTRFVLVTLGSALILLLTAG